MPRILILLFIVALVACLMGEFPTALQSDDKYGRLIYLVILLMMVAAGGRRMRGMPLPAFARNAAIWIGLFLLCVLGYSYRDELSHTRLMAELIPQHVQINSDGSLSVRASDGGHFYLQGSVNDVPVRFLIDTGASDIVLSPRDADRAGFRVSSEDFTRRYVTANGTGRGAPVILNKLSVGSISLTQMPASVNQSEMDSSLLGMSFLRRLRGFKVEDNTLILIP